MCQNLYRTCRVIVLLIKPFVLRRFHQPSSPSCLLTQSQTVTICLKKIRKEMKPRPRSNFPEKLENAYVFKEHFHADCFESPRIL